MARASGSGAIDYCRSSPYSRISHSETCADTAQGWPHPKKVRLSEVLSMTQYQTQFKQVSDISENDRSQICSLYLSYYDGSDEHRVLSDLEEKTEVLLLYHEDSLVGFTTLQLYDFEWKEALVQIIYSGDTVVHHKHWGQQALAFAWIANLGKLKRERPDVPLFWFVILKGHRTFKFLPAFAKSFYPHWSIDRSDLKPLADALAIEKFGDAYSPDTGIVVFKESRGHLKPNIALPSKEEINKPMVQFFLERNPGYVVGNELVCLCEVTEENMRPLTKRIFKRNRE